MTLSDTLSEYIRACFTGIWITSHEHDDALTEIVQLCREQSWSVATWDIGAGLQLPGEAAEDASAATTTDPLAALRLSVRWPRRGERPCWCSRIFIGFCSQVK